MAVDAEMSFWDHLEDLRWMLMRVVIALAVFTVAGFAFIPYLFDKVVMAPSRSDFFLYRLIAKVSSYTPVIPDVLNKPFHVQVINIKLSSQFFVHMSLSFWHAVLLTLP